MEVVLAAQSQGLPDGDLGVALAQRLALRGGFLAMQLDHRWGALALQ